MKNLSVEAEEIVQSVLDLGQKDSWLKKLNLIDYNAVKQRAENHEEILFEKWGHKIKEGFYGFDLYLVPREWIEILDRLLIEIEGRCPDFAICQIKTKFGGVRIYLDNVDDVIKECKRYIEEVLYNEDLIY